MYQKVSPDMNFVDREKNVGKFWRNQQIFEKSMKAREGKPVYTFYDGPPTANGKPHIGHVLTRVIKDMIPRYKTMKGYMVPRKAGWDTHGVRSLSGNIRECGRTSPVPLVSGQIWTIHMSPMMTISSSPSGGL